MTTNSNNNNATTYFDLHISGIGFLNRAREVEVKGKGRRSAPFLAVDIAARTGDKDYTRFDCRVSGHDAQDTVRGVMAAIEADKKVLARFKIGDLYPDLFEYPAGSKRAGETGVSLKARLLRTDWVEVDEKPISEDLAGRDKNVPLEVRGVAYLNRIHEIDGRLVASLSALRGKIGEVEYTYFDAEVAAEAEEVIRKVTAGIGENAKVLIGFKSEGVRAETFVYKRGEKAGQTGVSLSTRLVSIGWAKVDGRMVYQAPSAEDPASEPEAREGEFIPARAA